MVKSEPLVVEADTPSNCDLFFPPLNRSLRGRFEFRRIPEPKAAMLAAQWPETEIPGQRVEIDSATGKAAVVDPLYEARHEATRRKAEKAGWTLGPAREEIEAVDVSAWLRWIKRAVDSGLARVVQGTLPEKLPEVKKSSRGSDPRDAELAELRREVSELRGLIRGMAKGQQ
jgi:hypothetical protein